MTTNPESLDSTAVHGPKLSWLNNPPSPRLNRSNSVRYDHLNNTCNSTSIIHNTVGRYQVDQVGESLSFNVATQRRG